MKKFSFFIAQISLECHFSAPKFEIVGISTFKSRKKFMVSLVEHEIFITSGPGFISFGDIFKYLCRKENSRL